MRVLAAVAISAAVVGIVGARADADAQATKLVGSVDDLARISLNNQDGTPVTTLGRRPTTSRSRTRPPSTTST